MASWTRRKYDVAINPNLYLLRYYVTGERRTPMIFHLHHYCFECYNHNVEGMGWTCNMEALHMI